MQTGRNDDAVEPRLERLGHQGLQRMNHQRRPQPDHLRDVRRPARDGRKHFARLDEALGRMHAGNGHRRGLRCPVTAVC